MKSLLLGNMLQAVGWTYLLFSWCRETFFSGGKDHHSGLRAVIKGSGYRTACGSLNLKHFIQPHSVRWQ